MELSFVIVSPEHIVHALLLAKLHYILAFGGTGSSGPTLQQQQLATEQALTTANLNLEENSQRKSILNALQGTRVFRESALSRAVAGNTNNAGPQGAPSAAQQLNTYGSASAATNSSLLDISTGTTKGRASPGGATPAGGAGASGNVSVTGSGGYGGNRLGYGGIK
jgi:hypothetical protein